MGCTDNAEKSGKYQAFNCPWFKSGHLFFVGKAGALRKGYSPSRSVSIGSPSEMGGFYTRVLLAGDTGKDPGPPCATWTVQWMDGGTRKWADFILYDNAEAFASKRPGSTVETIKNCSWHPLNAKPTGVEAVSGQSLHDPNAAPRTMKISNVDAKTIQQMKGRTT